MVTFGIKAQVVAAETGLPLAGLFVKAYDKDLLFDDLLGGGTTGLDGRIEIVCEQSDFREFFDKRPDIYFKVFTPDRVTLLHTTKDAVRWNAGRSESFVVRVPSAELAGSYDHPSVRLLGDPDEAGAPAAPAVGDSLTVAGAGLVPGAAHEIDLLAGERTLFTSRLMTDRYGTLEQTVLWPQFGLDDPSSDRTYSVEEAEQLWRGRALTVRVRFGERVLAESTVATGDFTRPLLLSTDASGRMLNGFELGGQGVQVAGYNLHHRGVVRVYLVPRQHDWAPGNSFAPVILANGRPAFVDATVGDDGRFTAEVARADELRPGAYDFIVRTLRYGYEDDEDFVLRATDAYTRRVTGVVVRQEFMASKVAHGGCVNMLPVSGRSLSGAPYFRYADSFQVNEKVYAAIDPGALPAAQLGKMVAIHVVLSKDAATWSADAGLTHLAALGGNANVLKVKTQAGCVNANKHLIWAAAQFGTYDIVLDFGNDAADLGSFVPDHIFNTAPVNDIIDGYMAPGFRVVVDPTVLQDYAQVGAFQYDESSEGTLTINGDDGATWNNVPLRAAVRFPADFAGATLPSQISGTLPSYPLAVMVHGNGHSYLGYHYLLEHWARNGFIAASIHLQDNMKATGRVKLLVQHLAILKSKFGTKAADNIGIVGHSRGGEAVALAPKYFNNNAVPHTLNAVVSLAPVNQYHDAFNDLNVPPYNKPLLVIYGSMDGDVNGSYWTNNPGGTRFRLENSGFAHYDKANGSPKAMVFVYGATHNRFTTIGSDADLWTLTMNDQNKLISQGAHEAILKAYSNAFFRRFLKGEAQWDDLLKGEWVPTAVATADAGAVRIFTQYHDLPANRRTLDSFEGAHTATSWQMSTINDAVSHGGTLPVDPTEDELYDVDTASPHDTSGLLLQWNNTTDKLEFAIPAAPVGLRNVAAFNALSFRVTQRKGSAVNPVGVDQDLYVELLDGNGNRRGIRVSKFVRIPPPHERDIFVVPFPPNESIDLTKSAMNTVRIPLYAYTIECAGLPKVNLTDVVKVTFNFQAGAQGEIEIDDVELSK